MASTPRRNKRSAPIVIDLEETAKKPKLDCDDEAFLSHFKQLFHAELTTMETMIRNLLLDVTNKEKEIQTLKEETRLNIKTKESEANNALAEMERKMTKVLEENRRLTDELKRYKSENYMLLKKFEDQQRAQKSEQVTRTSEREKMNSLETENMSKTEKIKSLEARLKDRNEKNTLEAKEKIEKYRKQIADIECKNKTQSMLISSKESEVQTLKDSLKEKEGLVSTFALEKDKLEHVLSTRAEEIDYLSQAKDELEIQYEESKAELERVRADLTEKYREMERSEQTKENRILELEKSLQSVYNFEEIKKGIEKLRNLKFENESLKNEIKSLKKQLEYLEKSDRQQITTMHRLETIIYAEKEEEQEDQLVTSEPEKEIVTDNKISCTIPPLVKRPRGRPKKNIVSAENDLKNHLYKDRQTTIRSIQ